MTVIHLELALLVALAVISDIGTCKIKNILIVIFTCTGLVTSLAAEGLKGLAGSAAGAVIPFILLFTLYFLRMLGAGDIKLFCTIGAIGGPVFVIYSMVYSFLSGGIMALALILLRRNARERAAYLTAYIKACFLSRSLLPYTDFTNNSDGAKFRFSIAIACGTVIAMNMQPLIP